MDTVQSVPPSISHSPAPQASAAPPRAAAPPATTSPSAASRPAADRVSLTHDVTRGEADKPHGLNLAWAKDPPGGRSERGAPETLSLGKGETLHNGSKGDNVSDLQRALNRGGAGLDVDGKLGRKTESAVREFQRRNGLDVDGIVGPKTLAALNGPAASPPRESAAGPSAVGAPAKAAPAVAAPGPSPAAPAPSSPRNGKDGLDKLPGPLQKYADTFRKAGEKYGVDPRLLGAISMHETGNGTSSAFRNKNNAMGISGKHGPLQMTSVEQSIDRMARGLADPKGYYRNQSTIRGISNIYAPIGAGNDPGGRNKHWLNGVSNNFRTLGGDPSQQVIFR